MYMYIYTCVSVTFVQSDETRSTFDKRVKQQYILLMAQSKIQALHNP